MAFCFLAHLFPPPVGVVASEVGFHAPRKAIAMSAEATTVVPDDAVAVRDETTAAADSERLIASHFADATDAGDATETLVADAEEDDEDEHNSGEENAFSSDDESLGGDLEWNIGFVAPEAASLAERNKTKQLMRRQHFPSKVGGAPAWLDPVDIPTGKQLKCLYTREQMDFLMQIYAPVDGDDDDANENEENAFHRAVFVFVSPHGGDLHRPGAVRVFRSQLRRANEFYPDEPCELGGVAQELSDKQQADYDKRNDRWAERVFRDAEKKEASERHGKKPKTFPERELVVEPETFDDDDGDSEGETSGDGKIGDTAAGDAGDTEKSQDAKVGDTKNTSQDATAGDTKNTSQDCTAGDTQNTSQDAAVGDTGDTKTETQKTPAETQNEKVPAALRGLGADVSARELRELEKMQDKDMVQLSRFHLRLRRSDQTQVVRYCFEDGAEPLWPSVTKAPNHRDVKNVPNCARCGAKRRFEFQILPQLINHLDVDCELASAVDFGSIAVYTCSRSCAPPETKKEGGEQTVSEISEAYAEEVALVHPPLNA